MIETTVENHGVRHWPFAPAWFRWQVGRWETRPERVPVYRYGPRGELRLESVESAGGETVQVFRLLGWGRTKGEAEAMAQHAILRERSRR